MIVHTYPCRVRMVRLLTLSDHWGPSSAYDTVRKYSTCNTINQKMWLCVATTEMRFLAAPLNSRICSSTISEQKYNGHGSNSIAKNIHNLYCLFSSLHLSTVRKLTTTRSRVSTMYVSWISVKRTKGNRRTRNPRSDPV